MIAEHPADYLRRIRLDIETAEEQLAALRLERIRIVGELLGEHRMTQSEIASIAGITQARVSQIGGATAVA